MASQELPKNFDFKTLEPTIAERWLLAGCFERSAKRPNSLDPAYVASDFTVCMPPPNVTGILHMGHALGDTLQDALVRYHRMKGDSTRWIFGTDHAGISTQTKVDKKLKSEGVSRLEIGREAFIDACWDWTREYGGTITHQIKRMGCSCDFSDEQFTMSQEYAHAVRKTFCDWYHDGLIYRGKRIVNWCPSCKTAISDDECEYREEPGKLWYLRYPLTKPAGDITYITVATTRPETMLGDTGVAISPNDPRKAQLEGATVKLPIVDREIPIFCDWHVDPEFGTGYVKVTPAHDPNDFAMGEAHNLEKINIFDETAHVVEGYGEFTGLSHDEARDRVLAWFEAHNLLEKTEDLTHSVMHCYRCDTTLEPWLSEQWFVDVSKLKEPARDAAQNGTLAFNSDRWKESYLTWMDGLKDWCISRQLWWGHRIPVFTCHNCGTQDAYLEDVDVCPVCGSRDIEQDPDVLDTWFSSQLWPFATQGWPHTARELDGHYPTKVLVTARDIIALWVARMVMASQYFLKKLPFENVVIYPTILAKDGSRMSKSKGNGVDPIDLIDTYGADAMRHNLLGLVTQNQDVRFDAEFNKDGSFKASPRTEQSKAFVTKVWNATRFCLMNLADYTPGEVVAQTPEDKWILSRLAKVVEATDVALAHAEFGAYVQHVTSFFWQEVCDWYIEIAKGRLSSEDKQTRAQAQRNLVFVLDTSLRLMHPATPFVTEALYEALPASELASVGNASPAPFLMLAPWPEPAYYQRFLDDASEQTFEVAKRVIQVARSTRARFRLSPNARLNVQVLTSDEATWDAITDQLDFIKHVGKIDQVARLNESGDRAQDTVVSVTPTMSVYVEVGGLVDLAQERSRLARELEKASAELAGVQKTLANEGFLAKAAADVIAEKKARAEELGAHIEGIRAQIEDVS